MNLMHRLSRLPSFLVGSTLQTKASFAKLASFPQDRTGPTLLFVPGAFCTSSVMNPLLRKMYALDSNVLAATDFPYYLGPLANMAPLETCARSLLKDIVKAKNERDLKALWLVGHSNGGLISLLALDIAEREGRREVLELVKGVITMGTPFKGTDVALLAQYAVPCCKDIKPGAAILERIAKQKHWIRLSLQSAGDFLVPPENQAPDGITPVPLAGFQHMDFYVGGDEKVGLVARKLKECLDENHP